MCCHLFSFSARDISRVLGRVVAVSLSSLLLAEMPVVAADPTCGDYLAAVRENAERLSSGEYRASGTLEIERFDGSGTKLVFEELIEGAFDERKQGIYFSRTRRQVGGEGELRFGRSMRAWFVATPEYSVQGRMSGSPFARVSISPPIEPHEAPEFFQPIFDVRSLGFARYIALQYSWKEHLAALEKMKCRGAAPQGNGVYRLTLEAQFPDSNAGYRYLLWLDEQQGLQPVRFEVLGVRFTEPPEVLGTNATAETSWKEVDGVWVPVTLDASGSTGRGKERLQLSFMWQSVSDAIPDRRFHWKSLDLPQWSRVFDVRLGAGNPQHVATIGVPAEETIITSQDELESVGGFRWIVFVIGLVALGVLTGYFLRRHWARRSAE